MKNFIKNNLKVFVTLILSGIVFTGIGVYAASQYFARDISFTPTNENFKKENGESIDNVEDALNVLYENNILEKNLASVFNNLGGNRKENMSVSIELNKGQYICFSSYDNASIYTSTVKGDGTSKINVVGCDTKKELNSFSNYHVSTNYISGSSYGIITTDLLSTYCEVDSDSATITASYIATPNDSTPINLSINCIKIK